MKKQVAALTGCELDWAVGSVLNVPHLDIFHDRRREATVRYYATINPGKSLLGGYTPEAYAPSSDWATGGPLIQVNRIAVVHTHEGWMGGTSNRVPEIITSGETALQAAMRALVLIEAGDTLDIPNELATGYRA